MIENFTYIPKYVKQDSDLEYGEKVTHENYNEKLNLNTTQGDYNTQVLDWLLNDSDPEVHVNIPYLDKNIQDIRNEISGYDNRFTGIDNRITDDEGLISSNQTAIENILNGTATVGHANTADGLSGAFTAGPNKYYGTNADSEPGFLDVPDFLYAIDMETSTGVDGVYYVPALNSVAENMLTEPVREKLNRTNITDYDYLTNRPLINGVLLTGNVSLDDLGVQPAGSYVTDTEFATTLADYSTTTDYQSWVNTQLGNYATTSALSETNSNLSTTTNTANNAYTRAYACARVGVNEYPTNPQEGDIYFTV
jgi:hypothetical protein